MTEPVWYARELAAGINENLPVMAEGWDPAVWEAEWTRRVNAGIADLLRAVVANEGSLTDVAARLMPVDTVGGDALKWMAKRIVTVLDGLAPDGMLLAEDVMLDLLEGRARLRLTPAVEALTGVAPRWKPWLKLRSVQPPMT